MTGLGSTVAGPRKVLVRVQVYIIGQRLMYGDYTSKPNKNINYAISMVQLGGFRKMVQLGENRSTRPETSLAG